MEETETSEKTVFGLGGNLLLLGKGAVLVVILRREMLLFGDDTHSRRLFGTGNAIFWRRHSFSSPFLHRNLHFLATRPVLVVVFVRKSPLFGDETRSRRRFETENAIFWRREPFSSSFLRRNLHFLVTTPVLVVAFGRKTHFFGDETLSRRLFCAENSLFWRRHPFSSSLLGGKLHFLATKLVLVVFFRLEMLFFGDETRSRRHFCAEISFFWRRNSFSSSFWGRKRYFLATKLVLVVFFVWKCYFLATTPFLVVVLGRKTHFFGDETPYRRHFLAENSLFWRRHPFSSSFLRRKLLFLATTPLIVVISVRKSPLFGDETPSHRHFCA